MHSNIVTWVNLYGYNLRARLTVNSFKGFCKLQNPIFIYRTYLLLLNVARDQDFIDGSSILYHLIYRYSVFFTVCRFRFLRILFDDASKTFCFFSWKGGLPPHASRQVPKCFGWLRRIVLSEGCGFFKGWMLPACCVLVVFKELAPQKWRVQRMAWNQTCRWRWNQSRFM